MNNYKLNPYWIANVIQKGHPNWVKDENILQKGFNFALVFCMLENY